jgi:predicted GNAT family acetyltransferase
MPLFSQTITDFWSSQFQSDDALHRDERWAISVNSELPDDRQIMVLKTCDGMSMAVLTPALADALRVRHHPDLTEAAFRAMLRQAGVTLHGADYVYYFAEAEQRRLFRDHIGGSVRQLTEHDSKLFADFQASASAQDLDDAYVELEHWAVFGSFEQGRVVCVASIYPWEHAHIADLGVLTLAGFRGQGHARNVVRSISKHALAQGYQPQYRCQLDNQASASLARAAGLTLFGTWEPMSPESTT